MVINYNYPVIDHFSKLSISFPSKKRIQKLYASTGIIGDPDSYIYNFKVPNRFKTLHHYTRRAPFFV
jgi:hypothetical protein